MLLHARKLKQYLAVLFKLLDVGSHNAELVDTVAEHVGRRAYTVFHLLLQSRFGCLIAVAALHLILEHHRQIALRVEFAVLLAEDRHVVVAAGGLHHGVSLRYGCLEVGIAVGVGHGAQYVWHRHLKRHIHAALEVEAQAHAEFLNFGEGVAEIDFLSGNRIDIALVSHSVTVGIDACVACHAGRISLGLVLMMVGHQSEGDVEEANEHQEDGDDTGHDAS